LLDDVAGLADRFVGISLALAQWPVSLRFVHYGTLDALGAQVFAIGGNSKAFVGVGATRFEVGTFYGSFEVRGLALIGGGGVYAAHETVLAVDGGIGPETEVTLLAFLSHVASGSTLWVSVTVGSAGLVWVASSLRVISPVPPSV
jgi:hypothetical protein